MKNFKNTRKFIVEYERPWGKWESKRENKRPLDEKKEHESMVRLGWADGLLRILKSSSLHTRLTWISH